MEERQPSNRKQNLTLRIKELGIPPIRDGLVLGKKSPIGLIAMTKALPLLHTSPFEHIGVEDDIVSDILIRSALLHRISKEQLVRVVLEEVKPLMVADEIMHLDIEVELLVERQL